MSVFGRFIVDNRRKRIKKFAFSYENGLMWTGQNKSKTREGEIFSFALALVVTKTDTFKERVRVVGVSLKSHRISGIQRLMATGMLQGLVTRQFVK